MPDEPDLAPGVVTWGCEHMSVSAAGVIESLHFGCGCQPRLVVANDAVSQLTITLPEGPSPVTGWPCSYGWHAGCLLAVCTCDCHVTHYSYSDSANNLIYDPEPEVRIHGSPDHFGHVDPVTVGALLQRSPLFRCHDGARELAARTRARH